ncbi:hypothetical protein H112_05964 [Trichophyton rubrum D6]|uniref:Uncharacterized protein n=3 Tax=Trichophyton TaxID=5550 RepID=F2SLE1_TRIRC|nr:uncharacterized protein TERG_03671 [Trichophyton rubrum CBS 118892]EZF15211.1 hypothetical protein H100_05979 [Trichophyton rubrum MR850]EZF40005.1 hypothetical protein H102_05948 [Trichophyton rubrum CBS 100081]EZF50640.1 hypothetical protein H103_05974 [Trichophyton rubrum CBS 288.86]EZF61093.1 hypothetical protein H104_05961 [Trichophyton rubrum CBS 289.86]EZF71865.1 hypothetical protein H105_05988 [Trichophyton soudanense CBS 452.61]EZF82563.1 hypothetical protein H110_05970 [Trichophy
MHFISLITLSLVAVANGAALKEEATPGNGNNLVPAQVCKVGYNYCGWYLADGLGWGNVPDLQGLYDCVSPTSARYLEHCSKGCTSGCAHCA